jgi:hypothetical protein
MSTFGATVGVTLLHNWYTYGVTSFNYLGGVKASIAKVVADQTFFASTFICNFFVWMTLMNGGTL